LQKVAEVRNVKGLNARFTIIDGEQLLFMILDDKEVHPSYDIGIWLNTEFFAQALEVYLKLHGETLRLLNKYFI